MHSRKDEPKLADLPGFCAELNQKMTLAEFEEYMKFDNSDIRLDDVTPRSPFVSQSRRSRIHALENSETASLNTLDKTI